MSVSLSNAAPPQSAPPLVPGMKTVPFGPSGLPSSDRRRVERSVLVVADDLQRLGLQLRREVDEVLVGHALLIEGGRLARDRLRRRIPLAGHVALRHRPLLDRPHRLAVGAIEHVDERLLRHLRQRLDAAAVHGDVGEHRRGRQVVVPQAVMDDLEVPDALAGPGVEARAMLSAEQVVAGPRAAVVVAGGVLGRQVDVAELLVAADQRPGAAVARVGPRVVQPRLVAELALARHDVEGPQVLAGADVVAADVVGRHLLRRPDAAR